MDTKTKNHQQQNALLLILQQAPVPLIQAAIGILSDVAGVPTIYGFYAGDGSAATSAHLTIPSQIWRNANGSLFIADTYRIRKVDDHNIISTYSGNGNNGIATNNVPATSTAIGVIYGVMGDKWNNLYIAARYNNIIYKINNATNPLLHYFAGTGQSGYSGDHGLATNATFNQPYFIFVNDAHVNDSNKVMIFVADSINCVIRKIQYNIITTVIGTGGTCRSYPFPPFAPTGFW